MPYISDIFVSPAYLETGSLPKAYSFFDLEDDNTVKSGDENQETPEDLLKSVLYIEPQQHVLATADGSLLGIQLISEWQNKVLLELQSQMQHQNYARFNSVDIKGETRHAPNFANLAILKKFLSLQPQQQSDLADAANQTLGSRFSRHELSLFLC